MKLGLVEEQQPLLEQQQQQQGLSDCEEREKSWGELIVEREMKVTMEKEMGGDYLVIGGTNQWLLIWMGDNELTRG